MHLAFRDQKHVNTLKVDRCKSKLCSDRLLQIKRGGGHIPIQTCILRFLLLNVLDVHALLAMKEMSENELVSKSFNLILIHTKFKFAPRLL